MLMVCRRNKTEFASIARRISLSALLLLSTLLLAPTALHAQTVYYVSPSGSDSGAGTQLQPFQTIQHAASLVNPGDTVVVADGTYTSASGPIVSLSRGGTASARVTFRAEHVGLAKLDGRSNTSTYGFYFQGASYVTIDGFEIAGMASHGVFADVGHDIVLSRLHIHDIGRMCSDSTYGMDGVFVRVPNVTITRSLLHDIGRFSPGEQGCQPSTTYYENHDHGLYIDGQYYSSTTPGASNVLVSNSIFYRHQHGWAIQLYPGTLGSIRILNNTFAFPNPYRDGHILLGAATSSSVIANNIFYEPQTDAIRYYTGTQTNLQVQNNLVYGATLFNTVPGGTTVSGTITANPLLVNVSSEPYDFHLQSASPAIGAGLTFSDVTVDYDGNARPSGAYDIGASQYASSTTTTTTVVAAPSITPDGGSFNSAVQVSLATTTSGATIRYTTNGTAPTSSSPVYSAPFTVAASGMVEAQATESGMTDSTITSATFQVVADTTAPTVALTSPANGATVTHNTTLAVSASDNVGVVKVQFFLDGALIGTDTSAPYSMTYNFTKAAKGAHTLSAVASDAAGNTAKASITVYR